MEIAKVRQDFPILFQTVNDEPLIYLDNAATTQKPKQVISAIENYYAHDNANVHRGVHTLSERATKQYEEARETVRAFINAASTKEVLFTRGTTTSLNWVAQGFGDQVVEAGDEIYVTALEHHSNLVPWQQLAKRKQARLVYLPLTEEGSVDVAASQTVITSKGKILAVTQASNVMGTINPIKELAAF
uniref:aminotransferase class V-fold PLP-dependent enzyme n=1 Tax=Jeotgalibaca porci TaxID=1868793 RepID=UPI0035A085B8